MNCSSSLYLDGLERFGTMCLVLIEDVKMRTVMNPDTLQHCLYNHIQLTLMLTISCHDDSVTYQWTEAA